MLTKDNNMKPTNKVYFEQQKKLLCSVHSINNLFGKKIASFNGFKKTANELIKKKYQSKKNKANGETYRDYYSKLRPKLYDCEKGFFSPEIAKIYVNLFTDFILKDVNTSITHKEDIIDYFKSHKKSHGLIANVTKYDKKHHVKYNHSIALKPFRNRNKIDVLLLDSEFKKPVNILYQQDIFKGDDKIYTLNNIQTLVAKSQKQLEKQAITLKQDLNKNKHSLLFIEDIQHTLRLSPKISNLLVKKLKR